MAPLHQQLSLPPLVSTDILWDIGDATLTAESEKQLHTDTINVYHGLVDIDIFDEQHQKNIRSRIRFHGYRSDSKYGYQAPQTNDTLDVV